MHKVKLNITEEVIIEDYMDVNIDIKEDGTIHLAQTLLIEVIFNDLNLLHPVVNTQKIPACSPILLK